MGSDSIISREEIAMKRFIEVLLVGLFSATVFYSGKFTYTSIDGRLVAFCAYDARQCLTLLYRHPGLFLTNA